MTALRFQRPDPIQVAPNKVNSPMPKPYCPIGVSRVWVDASAEAGQITLGGGAPPEQDRAIYSKDHVLIRSERHCLTIERR
jgi:hypothetical protein